MNFEKLDKKVKKDIDENINTVPEGVNKRIDEALTSLGTKKKRENLKKVCIVAGVAVCLGAAGITTTAVAKGTPVKDAIFDILGFDDDYKKYATEINQSIEAYGVKATVTSAVHDGYKMTINFRIEGENVDEVKENTLPQIKIKGEEERGYEASYRMEKQNDGTVIGTYDVDLSDVNVGDRTALGYKDNIDIEFILGQYIQKTQKFKEGLKFKIKADAENVKDDIKVYKVNEEIEEGIIKEVIVTPFKVYIKGEKYKENNENRDNGEGKESDRSYINPVDIYNEYIIEDAKGIISTPVSSNFLVAKPTFMLQFENNFKDLSKIKFAKIDNEKENKTYEGILKINGDKVEINIGGNIKILESKKEKNNLKIKYKIKNPLIERIYIEDFIDKNMEKIDFYEKSKNSAIDKETGQLIVKDIKDGEYRISCGDSSNLEIIETIDLVK
ncbi:DUF4179 domain-containing protein [uncultured Clostridium sp.]|uniref:DUF4179 domain-containing protein n=1 Tax=uncultured Clostridium sp. TaxID=59620 RepID=UPI002618F908|nr:DUF4179 domain-containing protein [uncultured Clostridium sp.]